jgi:putative transcriptional regulator
MTKRNIGQEILESIQAIKRGEGKCYPLDIPYDTRVIRARMNLGLSAFASLLGVSVRTVRYWEQGKRKPSGASRSLLLVATKRPEVLLEILRETSKKPAAHV